jgi:2'-hydroxyisoflavone reductase
MGAALAAGALPAAAIARPAPSPPRRALRILILGGTSYIGPHQVRYALERGHSITLFNRGRTEPALFPELFEGLEKLEGDRNGNLEALRGRQWDAVIDNSATNPQWVADSAGLLKDSVRHYMFVSTTGVFLPYLQPRIDESVQPRLQDPPGTERPSYGVQKAQAERAALDAFGDRAFIVRPHFIVGPGDSSDRFPYWPVRIERGGEILVPGRKSDPVQFVDVRDLTEFMIRLLENGDAGVYNVAGPRSALPMEQFVYGVAASVEPREPIRWTWVEDYAFLEENNIGGAVPWILLAGDNQYMTDIVIDRAVSKGLTFRPLATTVRDMLEWWHSPALPEQRRASPRFVFSPERERELLEKWKARSR